MESHWSQIKYIRKKSYIYIYIYNYFNWPFSRFFFEIFRFVKFQVSQILMKPPSSILIFQLGFLTPRAIQEETSKPIKKSPFWDIFGTKSRPQKGYFLIGFEVSSQMALGVGNPSPGWKISIEDAGFIKIWLTWF